MTPQDIYRIAQMGVELSGICLFHQTIACEQRLAAVLFEFTLILFEQEVSIQQLTEEEVPALVRTLQEYRHA